MKVSSTRPAFDTGLPNVPYGSLIDTDQARRFFQALDNNLYMALGKEHRSIVIGSPSPGEGKTFLSLLTAFYSGHLHEDRLTLLVDCARSCDSVRALDMDDAGAPSLVGARSGASIDDAIRPSRFRGLHVCQVFDAGDRTSLLPKEKLSALAEWARSKFSTVIVDSESAQSSNDYVALTRIFTNILIVTRYRHTRKEQLLAELKTLEKAGCNVLGYVINERRFEIPNWLYGR